MSKQNNLYIGLMSGTSLDGIDAALVNFEANAPQIIDTYHMLWPKELAARLEQLILLQNNSIHELHEMDHLCADVFADSVLRLLEKASVTTDQVLAIGSHGQTIRHLPDHTPAYSLQIGNPNRIAELTGITTVADFRSRDIAAGGQGAPLVPAFHQAVFSAPGEHRVALNIGGIANITILNGEPVTGFDTGPGNRLLDDWVRKHKGESYDREGLYAASGQVNEKLLQDMLADPYFKAHIPKSTGTDYFNLNWLQEKLKSYPEETPQDIQATLSRLTADSIALHIQQYAPDCQRLIICGGGIHNTTLIQDIETQLPQVSVESSEAHGIHPDWVEAAAFAWLAQQTLQHKPGNMPSVTGASGSRILGGIYPGH